jgi:eukaryotic-like serine/threonine-protein kinase
MEADVDGTPPTEDRLGELLLRWDELRRQGRIVSAEDLCRTAPELLDELRRRIEAVRDMDAVLDIKATELVVPPQDSGPNRAIGNRDLPGILSALAVYRPERHYARGGLGEVLTARQEELDRTVALKRIRPDKLRGAARQRFLREAAITARLQHPGIVPVYGVGRDDDGPFYTMPLIEGQTLQEAIDGFHNDESPVGDPGGRGLKLRGLLQRFITVCNTVAYAHDQGVVHRDLKPANIMLGPYGETLVMDWGLAKRFRAGEPAADTNDDPSSPSPSPDHLTATGAVLGTPRYMSPEQAKGEPSTPASDVFSLGVILYAIMTGKPAFDEAILRGADPLKAVRDAAVVPLRKRDPSVSRALEAVCLKTLAARPDDRYASARGLGIDLENWLADEPVTAWREPWTIRAWRWVKRRRTFVTSSAAALIVAIVGLTIGLLLLDQARHREAGLNLDFKRTNTRLTLALNDVEQANITANKRLDQTMQSIADYYTGIGEEVLLGQKEFQPLRDKLLAKPIAFYENLARELEKAPATDDRARFLLAKGRSTLARLLSILGRNDEAKRQASAAIKDFEVLVAVTPGSAEYQDQLGGSYGNLGTVLHATGDDAGAIAAYRQAIAHFEALEEPQAGVSNRRNGLAMSYNNLGQALRVTGDLAGAITAFRQAVTRFEASGAAQSGVVEHQSGLAVSYSSLGDTLRIVGDLPGAIIALRKANESSAALVKAQPNNLDFQAALARGQINLGVALKTVGDSPGAIAALRQAKEGLVALVAARPNVPKYQVDLASTYLDLGITFHDIGDLPNANDADRQSIKWYESLLAAHPRVPDYANNLAMSYNNLSNKLYAQGDLPGALDASRRAVQQYDALVAAHPKVPEYRDSLAMSYGNLSLALAATGDKSEAIATYRRAINRSESLVAEQPNVPQYRFRLANSYNNVGAALETTRDFPGASAAYGQAITSFNALVAVQPKVPVYRARLAMSYFNLGLLQHKLGHDGEAIAPYCQSTAHLRIALETAPRIPHYRQYLGRCYLQLAISQRALGRVDEAAETTRERIKLWPNNPAELYDGACEFALCVPIGGGAPRKRALADQAMATLRAAVAAGYKDGVWMSRDTDLVALHDRDDFLRLVAELFDRSFPNDPFAR